MARMIKTKFGLVSSTEARCLGDLERWLTDKKKRERRAKQHGAFNLHKKTQPQLGKGSGKKF